MLARGRMGAHETARLVAMDEDVARVVLSVIEEAAAMGFAWPAKTGINALTLLSPSYERVSDRY